MTFRFKTIVFLIVFIVFNAKAQWTKGEKNGYYKLSTWYLEADQHYNNEGDIVSNATRGQFNVNFYGEYGLSNRLDVIGYIPFFSRTYENSEIASTTGRPTREGEDFNSIGDIDLGLRYGILKKDNYVLSSSLILGLPTGDANGGSDGSFQTGDGEFNQLLRVSLGIPFGISNASAYAKTYVGYNNRTENFSDELRIGAELGVQPFNKLWLAAKLDVVESMRNGSLNATNSNGSIFANNMEFMAAGLEANYSFVNNWGISLNYTSAFRGEIVFAAPSYSAGIFLEVD